MTIDREAVDAILDAGRRRGAAGLLESEGLALLAAMGVAVPRTVIARGATGLDALPLPPGGRAVVKVLAPGIAHKTDVGGVEVVPNTREAIRAAVQAMEARFADQRVDGFAIQEFVEHEAGFGHELLIGVRWTDDFGPVVTVGPGGVATEALAAALRPDEALAIVSPALTNGAALGAALARVAAVRQVTEPQRGHPEAASTAALERAVQRFFAFAETFVPDPVAEFEVNPLVVSRGRLVALDALVRFGAPRPEPAAPRPLGRIARLLRPRSIALMGVSERMNPGRLILRNLLAAGTPADHVTVVKPGCEAIDGCRCVPSLEALPGRVDLLVLSIAAAQVPDAIGTVLDGERAESVILIPGGLDETPAGRPLVDAVRERLARARETAWGGPVINGGNCLGVRSAPGRMNTLFIPETKLPAPPEGADPVALISGSGAFAVARLSKLAGVNPRYVVSAGNQMDLTLGDWLEHLGGDADVRLFAVYAEGFRPLDGLRFAQAAARVTASGRTVVLYAGGRTSAGASAAASHTAAVAGDYEVLRQVMRAAGVIVADSLEAFEDAVGLFARLGVRDWTGAGLGAVTNAGFESVAIADHLGAFRLAALVPETVAAIEAALERARLGGIVTPRNPIDLTPTMGDEGFVDVVRAVLHDPGVDAGLIGCVPLTGALQTLEAGPGHAEDVAREDSLASRLVRLAKEVGKPWVAVVDGGARFDAMAARLEAGGVPVFRTADRALRALGVYVEAMRRRANAGAQPAAQAPAGQRSTAPPVAAVVTLAGRLRG